VRRLLVVSHPSVVPANQSVYAELLDRGWDLTLVVPSRWRDEHHDGWFEAKPLPELDGRLVRLPVAFAGRPQRHMYLARPRRMLQHIRPDVAFIEQEPFALAGFQWARAAVSLRVPFGLQMDENLDRPYPWIARALRSWTLERAAFIAARSPAAGELAGRWGARGRVEVVPHAVPAWETVERANSGDRFIIGFAGRLVEEKGLRDLVAAARLVSGRRRLLLVGDGPLRGELERLDGDLEIDIDDSVSHETMASAYARMDVLVLPSRTTEKWKEQFGRVLVEALWCGVPVIGSSSGAIPWVIGVTQGGLTFREGDARELAGLLERLRDSPLEREELARRGREGTQRHFSVEAAADGLESLLVGAIAG
jgi:glycosyltransferase involved in cell wall biosynthesis